LFLILLVLLLLLLLLLAAFSEDEFDAEVTNLDLIKKGVLHFDEEVREAFLFVLTSSFIPSRVFRIRFIANIFLSARNNYNFFIKLVEKSQKTNFGTKKLD